LGGSRREEDDLLERVVELSERVAALEESMRWVRKILHKVDLRTWFILAGVIVGILVALLR